MRALWTGFAALLTLLTASELAGAQEAPVERTAKPAPQRVRYTRAPDAGPYSFLSTEISVGAAVQAATGTAAKGFGSYSDLFGTGSSFEITALLRMVTARRGEASLTLGPLLRASHTMFGGSSAVSGSGDVLSADGLQVSTVMLGFHLTPRFGEFYFGPTIGFGPSFLSGVDATLRPASGAARSGSLYNGKMDVAFDIRLRAGWAFEFEGGHRIGVEVFMGYSTLGRPDEDTDPGALVPGADPSTLDGGRFGMLVSIELRRPKRTVVELR